MRYKTKAIEKFEIARKTTYEESEPIGLDFTITKFGKKGFAKDGDPKEIADIIATSFRNSLDRLGELKQSRDYKIELVVKLRKWEN